MYDLTHKDRVELASAHYNGESAPLDFILNTIHEMIKKGDPLPNEYKDFLLPILVELMEKKRFKFLQKRGQSKDVNSERDLSIAQTIYNHVKEGNTVKHAINMLEKRPYLIKQKFNLEAKQIEAIYYKYRSAIKYIEEYNELN